jgi:hypothetical protein
VPSRSRIADQAIERVNLVVVTVRLVLVGIALVWHATLRANLERCIGGQPTLAALVDGIAILQLRCNLGHEGEQLIIGWCHDNGFAFHRKRGDLVIRRGETWPFRQMSVNRLLSQGARRKGRGVNRNRPVALAAGHDVNRRLVTSAGLFRHLFPPVRPVSECDILSALRVAPIASLVVVVELAIGALVEGRLHLGSLLSGPLVLLHSGYFWMTIARLFLETSLV